MISFYIIVYLVFYTVFTCGYRELARKLKRPAALTILVEFMAGSFVLVFIPFFELKAATDLRTYFMLFTACIFYSISDRINTIVRANVEASFFSVLRQINTVIMIAAGFLIQNAPFQWNKIIGAAFIIGSNILIFYQKGNLKVNKYLLYGIISGLASCAAQLIDINASSEFNLAIYISMSLLTPAIIIMTAERIRPAEVIEEFKNGDRRIMLITALASSASPLLLLLCYTSGDLTIVAPLCSLTVFLTVIVSCIFLNEKDDLKKKFFSGLLVIIGIIIINRRGERK